MFIVIEGFDAAGKATQTKILAQRLERLGCPVETYSFHRYGTPLGSSILRHLQGDIVVACDEAGSRAPEDKLIFQCMAVADKYDAAPAIQEAIDRGTFVVTDRWWQSGYAYGGADGLPLEWLSRTNARLPQADLNILIEVSAEEARRRTIERGRRDRYEDDPALQERVRTFYHALWNERGEAVKKLGSNLQRLAGLGTWVIVDGMSTKPTVRERIEEVHDRIWQAVVREQERRFRR